MIRNNLDTYNYFFLNFDRCTNLISMMKVEEQLCPTKQNDPFETNVKTLKKSGHLKDSKDQISSTWNGVLLNIILGLIFAAIILSFLPLAA